MQIHKKQLAALIIRRYCERNPSRNPNFYRDNVVLKNLYPSILDLAGAFTWGHTPEGHLFWYNIYQKYSSIEIEKLLYKYLNAKKHDQNFIDLSMLKY